MYVYAVEPTELIYAFVETIVDPAEAEAFLACLAKLGTNPRAEFVLKRIDSPQEIFVHLISEYSIWIDYIIVDQFHVVRILQIRKQTWEDVIKDGLDNGPG